MKKGLLNQEKYLIKIKFAVCINKILEWNTIAVERLDGKLNLPTSLRSLETFSGISYNIIQNVSVANRDIQLTTIIRIIQSLEFGIEEFFRLYESLTEEEIQKGIIEINARKKKNE